MDKKNLIDYLRERRYIDRHGKVLDMQEDGNGVVVTFNDTFRERFVQDNEMGWTVDIFYPAGRVKFTNWTEKPDLDAISKKIIEIAKEKPKKDILIAKTVLEMNTTIKEVQKRITILKNLGLIKREKGRYVGVRNAS